MAITPPAPPVATPPKIVYVTFAAEINPHTTESLLAVIANCVNQKVQEIYLAFSTAGGLVAQGMVLYNVLRGMPIKLTTHNVGSVNSIGNVVFLAGETRYAAPHSTFMFHGVGFDSPQGVRLEEKLLSEKLGEIAMEHKRIGALMAERTKLTKEVIEGLFREAQTKDAAFAVSNGIVHEVRDLQVPASSTVVSLVFQR